MTFPVPVPRHFNSPFNQTPSVVIPTAGDRCGVVITHSASYQFALSPSVQTSRGAVRPSMMDGWYLRVPRLRLARRNTRAQRRRREVCLRCSILLGQSCATTRAL